MSARYLVRFDDVCPTMNWDVWEQIEFQLDRHGIRPIIAVVPDNQDAKLRIQRENNVFWSCVRKWQRKGWAIGLHGYQHVYGTADAGIVGLNKYSEFAGLSREIQRYKIAMAMDIMKRENVSPRLWVAPAHSFDDVTLEILKSCGLNVISDGMYVSPMKDRRGMTWIPQQMWRFHSLPFGTWTVCYHHNYWKADEIERFKKDIERYRNRIVAVDDILCNGEIANRHVWDVVLSKAMLTAMKYRRVSRTDKKGMHGAL